MSIKYFYNICLREFEESDLESDILAGVRQSYFENLDRIRDRITLSSDTEALSYEYAIEKDRPMKWLVKTAQGAVAEDVAHIEDSKYYICVYRNEYMFKRILFSRLHTLLKVEYFAPNGMTLASVEPRKAPDGLCLLLKMNDYSEPTVLFSAPEIADELLRQEAQAHFADYTAEAATNDGVVRFLSDDQRKRFDFFLEQAENRLKSQSEPVSFIDGDAPLADKLNAKDFNVKKNLSSSIDITMAADFFAENEEIDAPSNLIELQQSAAEGAAPDMTAIESDTEPDKMISSGEDRFSYYGELDDMGRRSGYGRTVTEEGRTAYEGCYLDDKRSGEGAYYYKDGSLCYAGGWQDNLRCGVGVGISSADGSIHAGKWQDNRPVGDGARLDADGAVRFVTKQLSNGHSVMINFMPDDSAVISEYDESGSKLGEKSILLTDLFADTL